ncbi:hypothetical protein CCR78_11605 [Rhodovulum imhoffii]|nr:hypothetical protein [Rhodovulum imhoffii]
MPRVAGLGRSVSLDDPGDRAAARSQRAFWAMAANAMIFAHRQNWRTGLLPPEAAGGHWCPPISICQRRGFGKPCLTSLSGPTNGT